MAVQTLTQEQLKTVSIVERTASVLSLLGSVFTIFTFCISKSFRKPINRLVFYASFGNMMCNVGTLMSRDYISHAKSAPCQLQAFLINTFMPADAFWTLAMALNVYLTFYHRFGSKDLRNMEKWYFICSYGIPLIPAFTYLFVKDKEGRTFYGNATSWCWISNDWDLWRFWTFYVPIWLIISVTMSIYIRAGRLIYERRRELLKYSDSSNENTLASNADTIGTVKTTEVTVTSELAGEAQGQGVKDKESAEGSRLTSQYGPCPSYAVHIAGPTDAPEVATEALTTTTIPPPTAYSAAPRPPVHSISAPQCKKAAWAYTKSALLFFTAILVTWTPSCANRIYPFANHGHINVPLEYLGSMVLCMQGFWNAVIYAAISWKAVKRLPSEISLMWFTPAASAKTKPGHQAWGAAGGSDHGPTRSGNEHAADDEDEDEDEDDFGSITDVESGVAQPQHEKSHPNL